MCLEFCACVCPSLCLCGGCKSVHDFVHVDVLVGVCVCVCLYVNVRNFTE